MSLKPPEKVEKLRGALYDKAKQEPDYRFYMLYDKVWRSDVLAYAYALSRQRQGAPGVDGVRFSDIEEYGVERWLGEQQEALKSKTYKPEPVRRVMIPKAGGVGERPLGIPTIRDRVVQTAAKLVLEPIFEADFDDAAHGYRPGRSAQEAVAKVQEALQTGHTEVVDADISQYFDTIPHTELMQCLARRISDRHMLHLLKLWLKVPVEVQGPKGGRYLSGGKKSKKGVPQGGVISPLLANIYMHRYIKAFRKYELDRRYGAILVNYADDFVVLCRRGGDDVLATTRRWMTRIGLALNESKTSLRNGRKESFDFLGYRLGPLFSPRTGGRYLGASPSTKALRHIKEQVRSILRPGNQGRWEDVVPRLNAVLRGWATYFSFGTVSKTRNGLDTYVYHSVRRFLRRRHKVKGGGFHRFTEQYVFGELGVLRSRSLPRSTSANAWS